jgi:hypothetical protein
MCCNSESATHTESLGVAAAAEGACTLLHNVVNASAVPVPAPQVDALAEVDKPHGCWHRTGAAERAEQLAPKEDPASAYVCAITAGFPGLRNERFWRKQLCDRQQQAMSCWPQAQLLSCTSAV